MPFLWAVERGGAGGRGGGGHHGGKAVGELLFVGCLVSQQIASVSQE